MLNIKVMKNSEFTQQNDNLQTKQISKIQSMKYFLKSNPYE